ncbi:restriction endonuclease subunit S [Kribbella sp. NPDC026596]|uniref:restriction endonuclease subunit S n=1 Tax=Kribbella sp. NPDC026596 TaxID=3155122 RepID=UPI003407D58B
MSDSGWSATSWGDIATLKYGKSLRDYKEGRGQTEVFGTNGPVGWTDSGPLAIGPRPIVGRKGAYRGVHLARGPFWVIDTAYWLKPGPALDPTWAYYKLLTLDINGMDSGSAIPSLAKAQFEGVPLDLPPMREQRRIAYVLSAFDELIETNRRIAEAALEVGRASFSQLAARSLDLAKLSDVTTKIGSGATPRGGKDVYQEEGTSFIRSQNVYDGQFSYDGLARISDGAADALSGVAVLSGDVLVNITGESVARTALVPNRALPARVSQHVAIIRADAAVLDYRFLMLALLSAPIKGHLNGLSTAGATRRALTKAHLGETRIPMPPLAEQRRVSRVLEAIGELGDELADLTRTRDELLPLLMSGQVRVSEDVAVA